MTNAPATTAVAIMDAAQRLVQAVGYNGLSFRDLATAVGVRSASVHYHFPTKGHLGAAIARRYTDRLVERLGEFDAAGANPKSSLAAYVSVIGDTLDQDGRMCLCGMLAAETDAIPPEVRAEVRRFIDLNVSWLASVLQRINGATTITAPVREHATAIFAALEGAMLIARGAGDPALFRAIAAQFERVGLLPR